MNHLLTAELFELERAALVRRLRRRAATGHDTRSTPRRRTAR